MEGLRYNNVQHSFRCKRSPPTLRPGSLDAWCSRRGVVLHATRSSRPARERVLRYPDGHERRIIYPEVVTLDEDDDDSSSWDVTGLWSGAVRPKAMLVEQEQHHQHNKLQLQQHVDEKRSLRDAAAFLEGLFAASYAAQPLEDISQCYQVLSGCPWLLPRPMFVLTSQHWGWQAADGIQSTYTLRVKVVKEGAADELAKLLNKQFLAAALDVAEMLDGVVLFESAADADRFASKLEEEGHSQVMVAEVDSHKVFKLISDLNARAVLLRQGASIPAPYQLAAALKSQQGMNTK